MSSFLQWISNWARTLTWVSRFWNNFLSPALPNLWEIWSHFCPSLSTTSQVSTAPWEVNRYKKINHAMTCWDDQEPRISIIPVLNKYHPNFAKPSFSTFRKYSVKTSCLFFVPPPPHPGVFSQGEKVSAYFYLLFQPWCCLVGIPSPKRGLSVGKRAKTMNQQAKCKNQWE